MRHKLKLNSVVEIGTYKGQPLEWRVIKVEKGKALVITTSIIDLIPFNTVDKDITWKDCTLRSWLNKTFFTNAFLMREKKLIEISEISTAYFKAGQEECFNTRDRVFVLSNSEVRECFNPKEDRRSSLINNIDNDGYSNAYWLRNPGYKNNTSCFVNGDTIYTYKTNVSVNTKHIGVRPAMWIKN